MSELIVRHFDCGDDGFELVKSANGARFEINLDEIGCGIIECSYSDLIQIKDAINQYLISRSVQ